ncbi:MAG: hypothetical protein QXK07_05100 [Desulfurococcaceae archaeon]
MKNWKNHVLKAGRHVINGVWMEPISRIRVSSKHVDGALPAGIDALGWIIALCYLHKLNSDRFSSLSIRLHT